MRQTHKQESTIHTQNKAFNELKETMSKELTCEEVKMKVTQLRPALCDPMDYAVHGILQARMSHQTENTN